MGHGRGSVVTLVVVLASGCSFQASCGGKLDSDKLEKAIASFVEGQLDVAPDEVTCPSDIARKDGDEFLCEVRIGNMTSPIEVTQTDGSGSVTYQFARDVIISDKVEALLAQRLQETAGVAAKVDCGQRMYDSNPGATFACVATDAQGVKVSIGVTVEDDKANVKFDAPTPVQ